MRPSLSTKPPRQPARRIGAGLALALLAQLAGCAAPPTHPVVSRFSQIGFHDAAPPTLRPAAPHAVAPRPAGRRREAAAVAAAPPQAPAQPPAKSPPSLRPRIVAADASGAVLAATVDQAQARVAAYLERAGFALETRQEDGGALISATRMGPPTALQGQATCALEAMRRPTFSSTELTVRLSPAPGGVQVRTEARFVLVDTRIVSGDLARQTCRSDGALEGAIRTASAGD